MFSVDILVKAAIETTKISIPTIADAVLHRTNFKVCDGRLHSWSKNLLEQARITLQITGREHVSPGTTYVVMSNHQSHYDIPVMFQALGIRVRMIAKTELFRIPVMGRAMIDSGFVELDRSNRRRAVESMKIAKRRMLDDGLSIWIAPEGTRSRDGRLGEFKTGGFYLALDAAVPILPVTIDGSIDVLRSGDTVVNKGRTVQVRIHQPIDVTTYSRPRMRDLMDLVHSRIASGLQAPAADSGVLTAEFTP
ncbi:MAG TPA: lysophospholipid acyltransferase family protein [Polyangiaceae bacterium]|jgi:1-acyl-sn-glycerol-3-phosphate acyltransferase|nr:lysophospholipid acyltransferase family protein [Polyangiaceae bacterium]